MRLWIRKSGLWALCCLSIWLVIEHYAGKEVNDYRRKFEVLKRCAADSLILGSSHAFYGVLADETNGAYNMSWSSQTLDETAWIAEQTPDNVHLLICISPFSLSTSANDRVEGWRNVLFNRTFGRISSDPEELSFLLSMGGRRTLRMAKNGWNRVGPSRIDEYGNGSRGGTGENFKNSSIAAHKRHFTRSIAAELKKTLIQLGHRPNTTFFTPPFHQSYQQLIAAEPNWVSTLSLLDSIKQSTQTTYTNYSNWHMPDSCFYDADHLNVHGQDHFTSILLRSKENSEPHALQQP